MLRSFPGVEINDDAARREEVDVGGGEGFSAGGGAVSDGATGVVVGVARSWMVREEIISLIWELGVSLDCDDAGVVDADEAGFG